MLERNHASFTGVVHDGNRQPGKAMKHRTWQAAFGICAIAVLVLSLLPTEVPMPSTGWDKSNHLLAFSVLAILGCLGYPGRTARILLGLLAYGGMIEILQSFTTYRSAEWSDLLADGLGLVLGWLLRALAGAIDRRRRSASCPPLGGR